MKKIMMAAIAVSLLAGCGASPAMPNAPRAGVQASSKQGLVKQLARMAEHWFIQANSNGDAALTGDERAVIGQLKGPYFGFDETAFDPNRDGMISKAEFIAVFTAPGMVRQIQAQHEDYFRKADANRDGVLSREEFNQSPMWPLMANGGIIWTSTSFAEADGDQDQVVNRSEYEDYMLEIIADVAVLR